MPGLKPPAGCWRGIAAFCLGWALAASMACAQGPAQGLLPNAGAPAATAEAPASAPASAQDWQARFDTAQQAHLLLQVKPEGSEPLLIERQAASARRLDLLAARLATSRAQEALAGVDARTAVPVPQLAGPPPYDVLEVDALRDQLDDLVAQQSTLRRAQKSLDAEFETALEGRAQAGAALRRQQERTARAGSGDGADRAAAELELASMRSQIAELELSQAEAGRQQLRQRLAALEEPLAQLSAEVERVRRQQRLDASALQQLAQGFEAAEQRLAAERGRLAQQLARRQASTTAPDAALLRELASLQQTVGVLRELESIERGKASIWRNRQEALNAETDGATRRAALGALRSGMDRLQQRQRSLAEEDASLAIELRSQHARLAGLPAEAPARAGEQRALEALQVQQAAQLRLREALERLQVLLARTRSDLGADGRPDSLDAWAESLHGLASGLLGQIWNYELFTATDSTSVDGRIVTVEHGVTIGKSIGALLLFALGYWASGTLSRRLVDLMSKRLHLSPHLARVLRRWISFVLMLAVLMTVLKMARIPITAFAFLGGALAIGIGFGTQNIIKNVISGIIILFERKIRVGDIVTVGGMSGIVQTVDLRATTVRGFDGIDAIVPNSSLLENQISNWSGDSPDVRRSVLVGVAYGSDVRRAAQLIADCAVAHASVLKLPVPEVLFEDFASDSLALRLIYWTRLGGPRAGPGVDSDLRYAIADALQAAGIGIAFPQRDVHLDVPAGALRVEIARAPAPSASRGPDSRDG
jgi:small-conductance mechanosensitive channel